MEDTKDLFATLRKWSGIPESDYTALVPEDQKQNRNAHFVNFVKTFQTKYKEYLPESYKYRFLKKTLVPLMKLAFSKFTDMEVDPINKTETFNPKVNYSRIVPPFLEWTETPTYKGTFLDESVFKFSNTHLNYKDAPNYTLVLIPFTSDEKPCYDPLVWLSKAIEMACVLHEQGFKDNIFISLYYILSTAYNGPNGKLPGEKDPFTEEWQKHALEIQAAIDNIANVEPEEVQESSDKAESEAEDEAILIPSSPENESEGESQDARPQTPEEESSEAGDSTVIDSVLEEEPGDSSGSEFEFHVPDNEEAGSDVEDTYLNLYLNN